MRLSEMVPRLWELPWSEELVRDDPDLTSTGGYVLDKVEGLAIFEDGTAAGPTMTVDDHSVRRSS